MRHRAIWKDKAKGYAILADAIKRKCRDSCCCGDILSWKECNSKDTCLLWEFRLGGLPNHLKKKIQNDLGKLRGNLPQDSENRCLGGVGHGSQLDDA